MSCVTIIWSVVAACALLLALIYGVVWLIDRLARAALAFACLSLAILGSAIVELGMMFSTDAVAWGEWGRWMQVPVFVLVAATAIFIRLYFRTGRPWLMWSIISMRAAIVVAGFLVDPNFTFDRIDSIEFVPLFGERIAVVGHAIPAPWQWFASLTTVMLLVYVADAAVQLWRSGSRDARRKAVVIGGATFASAALASTYAQLMIWGGVRVPVLVSPPFLIMLTAMAFELARDTLRASRLARELRDSEARLDFAATAAGLGLWSWDADSNRVWATSRVEAMFGLAGDEPFEVARVRSQVDAADLSRLAQVWHDATASGEEAETKFRIRTPEGCARWVLVRGRAVTDAAGRVTSVQGVLRDITDQQLAREENEELRRDLAHVGRVSMLGTLSSSLVHELSQPLGAILLNTDAAELILRKPQPDLAEIREILADIRRDDSRAAEVIERLRKLLKRRQMEFLPISAEALVQDVGMLLKSDALARNLALTCSSEQSLPWVRGDRVHLSQVLINMVMNAMDAVADLPPSLRSVSLHARTGADGWVELEVADSGTGVPTNIMARIFEPFFTTKAAGMGMGLSVSRTIVDAHGGRLWAENRPGAGAMFCVALPASV